MMKKIVLLCLLASSAQQLVAKTYYGSLNISNKTVYGKTIVYGSFTSKQVVIKSALTVTGDACLEQTNPMGPTTIVGTITTLNSSFDQTLTLDGSGTFKDSELAAIIVKKPSQPGKDVVHLVGKTVVLGTITFESGSGKVYISATSAIKGKLVGGKIMRKP